MSKKELVNRVLFLQALNTPRSHIENWLIFVKWGKSGNFVTIFLGFFCLFAFFKTQHLPWNSLNDQHGKCSSEMVSSKQQQSHNQQIAEMFPNSLRERDGRPMFLILPHFIQSPPSSSAIISCAPSHTLSIWLITFYSFSSYSLSDLFSFLFFKSWL